MPYVLNTGDDQRAMLSQIGAASIDELFRAIPEPLRLKRPLGVPPALSEIELTQHMAELARRNQSAQDAVCFLRRRDDPVALGHGTSHRFFQ